MSGSPHPSSSPGPTGPGDFSYPSAAAFSGTDTPARRDDQVSAEVVGNDYALHDGRTGRVHFLNQTAAAVWDLLDGSSSVDELIAELGGQFAADPSVVRDGVLEILALFQTEGLLRRQ